MRQDSMYSADIHSSSDDSFDDPVCDSRLAVDKFTAAGSGWAAGSSYCITVTSRCRSAKATAHGSAMTLKDQWKISNVAFKIGPHKTVCITDFIGIQSDHWLRSQCWTCWPMIMEGRTPNCSCVAIFSFPLAASQVSPAKCFNSLHQRTVVAPNVSGIWQVLHLLMCMCSC